MSKCTAFMCITYVITESFISGSDYHNPVVIYRWLEKCHEELHNSTGARGDDPSYTASQPTVALMEYVDV